MKIQKQEIVYQSKYFRIRQATFERHGKTFTKDFFEKNATVLVIPYTSTGQIYLESQYRDAFEREILEIVAGTVEAGGDPLE
ncbi:MAG: hypothetical protein ACRD4B_03290, partial [Acidobacteriota bacterium]